MTDHGEPIDVWAVKQKDFTAEDKADVIALRDKGAHTVHDLSTLLASNIIPRELAVKVRRALKQ